MHAHRPRSVRRAILIILTLATIAWVAFLVSDTQAAAPESLPTSTTAPRMPVQPPGSSLEGINEPLSKIIADQRAAEQAAAAAAEAARQAAARAAATARPPVPATPSPAAAPRPTQCPADIVALIDKHWSRFGPQVVQWAISIAWRESNCRPDVTSPTRCAGIYQVCVPLHADLFTAAGYDWHTAAWEAEPNIIVAANLYASSGPGPWRL
jgi:hypothetical protein